MHMVCHSWPLHDGEYTEAGRASAEAGQTACCGARVRAQVAELKQHLEGESRPAYKSDVMATVKNLF